MKDHLPGMVTPMFYLMDLHYTIWNFSDRRSEKNNKIKIAIAVCKDSYVVYACCFDQVGKWSGFTESMRITINMMIFRHLCHLALDHWKGRTYCSFVSMWFSAILSDLQTTLKFLCGDSWWFSVICKQLWNFFGTNIGDSQTTLKFLWGHSQVLLDDSQWFVNHSEIS